MVRAGGEITHQVVGDPHARRRPGAHGVEVAAIIREEVHAALAELSGIGRPASDDPTAAA